VGAPKCAANDDREPICALSLFRRLLPVSKASNRCCRPQLAEFAVSEQLKKTRPGLGLAKFIYCGNAAPCCV
jgi:hypothetical protein